MRKLIVSAVFTLMLTTSAMALDIRLSHSGPGLRVLTTKEAPEDFGRGLPMGPSSMRLMEKSLWVVDSIAGRMFEFDLKGKPQRSFSIKDGGELLISDFAFLKNESSPEVAEAIWAVGSEKTNLIKVDLEGKILARFTTNLSVPRQLEVLTNNQLAVYDEATSAIVVFSGKGKMLWQQTTVGNGFSASGNKIFFIGGTEAKPFFCSRNINSEEIENLALMPMSTDSFPSIIHANENEAIFSFHSMSEKTEEYEFNIARISLKNGDIRTTTIDFPAPFLSRPIIELNNRFFLTRFITEKNRYFLRIKGFNINF